MELDYRIPNDITCATDIKKLRKHTAKNLVYMFLIGLDRSLNMVNSWVLATFPLPSLEIAFS